jgi:hypothetical protein
MNPRAFDEEVPVHVDKEKRATGCRRRRRDVEPVENVLWDLVKGNLGAAPAKEHQAGPRNRTSHLGVVAFLDGAGVLDAVLVKRVGACFKNVTGVVFPSVDFFFEGRHVILLDVFVIAIGKAITRVGAIVVAPVSGLVPLIRAIAFLAAPGNGAQNVTHQDPSIL